MERALDGFRGCVQGKRRFDSQPMVIIQYRLYGYKQR